jgi:hypothetical protein
MKIELAINQTWIVSGVIDYVVDTRDARIVMCNICDIYNDRVAFRFYDNMGRTGSTSLQCNEFIDKVLGPGNGKLISVEKFKCLKELWGLRL